MSPTMSSGTFFTIGFVLATFSFHVVLTFEFMVVIHTEKYVEAAFLLA